MKYLGIVSEGHDASVALIEDSKILFAGHAERYSKIKNDSLINDELLYDAFSYGYPDEIVFYEKPWLKKSRQILSGEKSFLSLFESNAIADLYLDQFPIRYVGHHESHAAAGYFTSKFDNASILVCDAIGEWTTTSIWRAEGKKLKRVWSQNYPDSLGLFYSAMTQRLGLKPNEEEYIMMGMAALGSPAKYLSAVSEEFLDEGFTWPSFKLNHNVHRGISWWKKDENFSDQDKYDLAATVQLITEMNLNGICEWIANNLPSKNLVLMGGVALNCVANSKIAAEHHFNDIWIMPNPGDAGSSIGAVAAYTKQHLDFDTPYLGYNIKKRFNFARALEVLLTGKVIGIASGRAEFGPRALGNRSILADPRSHDIKDKVNLIKKRERFRPFAPVILEELVHEYFELPVEISPYMQFTAKCKYPDKFPGICHVDGTSRVQTINEKQNSTLYHLILEFYKKTGCPMLLNTSLNIKGQPLVNDEYDAQEFRRKYGIKVF